MTKPYKIICRFLFELVGMISLDRNDRKVVNLLFVSPILFCLNILETEKILQLWNKKILDGRGTSFQSNRLIKCFKNLTKVNVSRVLRKFDKRQSHFIKENLFRCPNTDVSHSEYYNLSQCENV